ncbi:DUF3455 domain-containing protein [Pyxidicoccus parkwayensis]|uniref:DUF3455 domain-containing protein n=1 Tax=Pyxidicoccus parkwayensis TaxID=2813578 RepID=A0ABX7P7N0_9BACT|nr:DUF3455 domain-containing protein [Pyxidicoccus parkwaysis]QSQ26461.1 DUF3455 domain-containing protein [Pyxidicoccus parkwaysis]
MKTARPSPSCVIAALSLSVVVLGGCDDDDDDVSDADVATEALKRISQDAPTALPEGVPADLLRVNLGGTDYDLRDLLNAGANARPSARIVAAYETVTTPADPPPLGTSSMSLPTDVTPSEPAAQVYECHNTGGTFAWTFLRPEAGLRPITTQTVQGLDTLVFDHFRYPGGIDFGSPTGTPPIGPAWRVSAQSLNGGVPTSGQSLFIGAADASVPNGAENVPQLRLTNAARIDQGLPSDVFSRTTSDGSQLGYVLRLNTVGGIAPTSGCAAAGDEGKRERVPYSADYYFVEVLMPQ